MNLIENLKQNPFVLAPMAGITDHAFRSFMREMGAGILVTELVSATGLEYESQKTKNLMSFSQDQHPIGIQLFGEDPLFMANAARKAQSLGCDFVDVNLGCPVPKVVKKGAGSALMKDLPHLKNLLRSMKSSIDIPLTLKIRTGWDAQTRNALDVIQLAYDEGITWVAIHGRTRAQGYSGEADWNFITELKSKSPLPIIGNGDIHTPQQALQKLKSSGCDGVMIGRGALKNPYLFLQSLELWKNGIANEFTNDFPNEIKKSDFSLLEAYLKLHKHLAAYCAPPILLIQLKKFAAWYSSGYAGSSLFRKQVFQCQTEDEILKNAKAFFENVAFREDTSHESFLMGGHG